MADYFSAADLCAIIETCNRSGVSTLYLEGLNVQFNPVQQMTPSTYGAVPTRFSPDREYPQMEEQAMEQDEATLKMDRLQQLIIENPAEAEKLLAEEVANDDAES